MLSYYPTIAQNKSLSFKNERTCNIVCYGGLYMIKITAWDKFVEVSGIKALDFFTSLAKTEIALTTLLFFCPEAWLVSA